MLILDEEYEKNDTIFIKPKIFHKDELIKQNIVFLTSRHLEKNIDALLVEKGINSIRLTSEYEFNNIDFLKEYKLDFIESIDLLSDSIENIEGLYSLKNLKRINNTKHRIEYSKFENLISLGIELVDKYDIEELSKLHNLEDLSLLNKFTEKDLTIISNNKNLKKLTIRGSKLESLEGLQNFEKLEKLELYHNRNLKSLKGIDNHQSLEEIIINSAPKLFEINKYLSKVTKVNFLSLDSKKVDSFKFLDLMKKIELCGIHNLISEVEDGDKAPLIRALKRTKGKIW